jgi:hypothetical protein
LDYLDKMKVGGNEVRVILSTLNMGLLFELRLYKAFEELGYEHVVSSTNEKGDVREIVFLKGGDIK